MTDDAELLRRYAEQGSEPAFTELVRRHIDLVFGAALRRIGGDGHAAADITQQVFIQVARDARKLAAHPVLPAWLHRATRNAAVNHMISEQRRRSRETEALARADVDAMGAMTAGWEQVRPLLDAAIDELSESDRAAVVLRFLERRPFAEIGLRLKVSEDAARVRADRALDKLRGALARRGITSTASALAALVSAQPTIAAPAGLAATVASQALLATSGAPLALALFSTMTAKSSLLAAAGALVFFLAGVYVGSSRSASPVLADAAAPVSRPDESGLRRENDELQARLAALHADADRLREQNAQLVSRAGRTAAEQPRPEPVSIGMSRGEIQQAVLNNLRQIHAARSQYFKENNRSPERVQELVGRTAYIKRIATVDGENYADVPMSADEPMTVKTPDGLTITYDPKGETTTPIEYTPEEAKQRALDEQQRRLNGAAQKAFEAYRAAHGGDRPPNEQALIPYFATPKDGADFVEFLEAQKAARP